MSVFDPDAMLAPLEARAGSLRSASGAPAALVGVWRGGRQAEAATGVSDLASGVAAEAAQTYEVGSQTKLITAVVVLQLADEGLIDLDAPAANWLPDAVVDGIPNARVATIRQMLEMRSGIPSYTEALNADGEPRWLAALRAARPFGPHEALDIARDMPATDAPGAAFNYSNTPYLLLGLLIEAVTGQSWAEALEERVFEPAGMRHTTGRQHDPDPLRLSSYQMNDGDRVDVTDALWRPKGEAGVVSTTDDMIAFLKALLVDRTLLSAEMLAVMSEFKPAGGAGFAHGLGLWQISIGGGRTVIGRGGGTLGTASGTWYDPASGTIVAMAATLDDAAANPASRSFGADLAGNTAWARVDDGAPLEVRNASAAEVALTAAADGLRLAVGEAAVTLDRALRATTTANTRFDDGSVLVVGDDAGGTLGDEGANTVRIARDYASALVRDNHLVGLGGDDLLTGGRGDDRVDGGAGRDALSGWAGADRVNGGAASDRLAGGQGDDVLSAGRGYDRLEGGEGKDELAGGAGTDTFRFDADASLPEAPDVIRDFDGAHDRIDLRPLAALDWIGRARFSGEAGELRYRGAGDDLRVAADLDGDGRADLAIALDDVDGLAAHHFLL